MINYNFPTKHTDIIHDLKYDYYGQRLATASADHTLEIWELKGSSLEWECVADIAVHKGSILKFDWAHPSFGSVIATASTDKDAKIFVEEGFKEDINNKKKRDWVDKSSLLDSKGVVVDVKFAPPHLGLKLAVASKDGLVRIYEATDIMDLSNWSRVAELFSKDDNDKEGTPLPGVSCVAWKPSMVESAGLVVGSARGAKVWEYSDAARTWQVYHILGKPDEVIDVAWAPVLGKSYHLIAVAYAAGARYSLKVFSFPTITALSFIDNASDAAAEKKVTECSILESSAKIVKVEFNVSGTLLACSDENGILRLFQRSLKQLMEWEDIGNF